LCLLDIIAGHRDEQDPERAGGGQHAAQATTTVGRLAQVYRSCPAAPAVWLALQDLAEQRGSLVVTPTRAHLMKLTGIRSAETVSRALVFWNPPAGCNGRTCR